MLLWERASERASKVREFTQCQKYVKRLRDMSIVVCFIFCMSAFIYICHKCFVMLLQKKKISSSVFQCSKTHIRCITLNYFPSSFSLDDIKSSDITWYNLTILFQQQTTNKRCSTNTIFFLLNTNEMKWNEIINSK